MLKVKLDEYLNKHVTITLFDHTELSGVLTITTLPKARYHTIGSIVIFRSSHVIKIVENDTPPYVEARKFIAEIIDNPGWSRVDINWKAIDQIQELLNRNDNNV